MDDIYHPVSSFEVTSDYAGMRLDNCLISLMKGLPRSKIYSIIRRGEVRVNKSRSRPSLKLNEGDIVRIPPYKASTKEETFTPSKDKEKILEKFKLTKCELDKNIVFTCGSGVTASVLALAYSLINIKYMPSIYDGSWSEYGKN